MRKGSILDGADEVLGSYHAIIERKFIISEEIPKISDADELGKVKGGSLAIVETLSKNDS